jgi:hypothetical protein
MPRRPVRPVEPDSERLELLEFIWLTRSGRQPVLYAVRTLLH